MQDKIVFRLETETNSTTSGAHGGSDTGSGLGASISTLTESVKALSSNLKSFTLKFNSIKENLSKGAEPSYAQTTSRMRAEAYKTRSEFLNDPQGKQIAQQRAEANLLRIETEKQRQDLKNDILKRASEYKLAGDTKFAKKLESDVSESLSGGINKGVNQSKLAQVFTAIGGAALIANTASKVFGSQSTAGLAMMQNPYTNGYNYGGQVAGVMQANTQKENAYVGLGTAGIGGTLMMSGNPWLKAAGVAVMAGGQAFNSYNSSQTNLKAAATDALVNNTMNAQALSATNQAASGIYTRGMYNRRITDVEQPLIIAMSKAAGVYNRNFQAMDKLTDYISAGNMSIQQGAGLSASVGFLTKGMNAKQQGNFIDTMKQSFSAYGVTDPAAAASNAMLYKQAGMGASEAAELAARATNLNPGAQGALANYYSQPIGDRGMQNFLSKTLYGVNLPRLESGKGDPMADAYRKSLQNFEKTGKMDALFPRALSFEKQIYNLTNDQRIGDQSDKRSITSTADQKKIQALTNQTIATNAEGMTLEKAIGTLNTEVTATSNYMSQLKDSTNQLTNAFNGLMSKLGTGTGSGQFHAPAKVPASKPMSGNTGTHYNTNKTISDNLTTKIHRGKPIEHGTPGKPFIWNG